MSESSNMKAPKKGQSKAISIWWIFVVLVIIALVFSIAAVIIAVILTAGNLKNYAQTDMLNSYVKTDELDDYVTKDQLNDTLNTWEAQVLPKYVPYDAEVHVQSKQTSSGGGGNLSDQRDAGAEFQTNSGDYEVMYIRKLDS